MLYFYYRISVIYNSTKNTIVPIQTNMHNNRNFNGTIFINENDPVNDILSIAEAATLSVQSFANRIENIDFKSAFRNFFKSLFYVIVTPIVVVISLVIYIIFAPTLRLLFFRRARKIASIYNTVKSCIEQNKLTEKELRESHKKIKMFLDKQMLSIHKLDGEPIFKPALEAYLSEIKKIEVLNRVAAYPDRNEVVLTYDELHELNHLTDLSF